MKLEHFAPVIEWWNDRREISVDGVVRERIDTTLVNMYWSVKR